MTKIDQNFELSEPQEPRINTTIGAERPKTAVWKRLIIVVPALIFFALLVSIIILSSNKNNQSSTILTPIPSPTPETMPTPHNGEIDRLINLKTSLEQLDVDQKEIQPPVLDLKIKF